MNISEFLISKGFDVYKDYQTRPLVIISNYTIEDLRNAFKEYENENQKKFDDSKFPFKFSTDFSYSITDILTRRFSFRAVREYSGRLILPYPVIDVQLMVDMFNFYDTYFFAGLLKAQADYNNFKYAFNIGNGVKGSAGTCGLKNGQIIITLHKPLFDNINPNNVANLTVNGLLPQDRLEAIMIVFEHELLHAGFETSTRCTIENFHDEHHGPTFKKMAFNLFGHLTTTHELIPTNRDKVYTLSDFRPNMRITVKIKDKIVPATVLKVNKTRMKIITDDQTKYNAPPGGIISILS